MDNRLVGLISPISDSSWVFHMTPIAAGEYTKYWELVFFGNNIHMTHSKRNTKNINHLLDVSFTSFLSRKPIEREMRWMVESLFSNVIKVTEDQKYT
jgi:hypothetical protein